jgi:hypothetical protein
MYETSHTFSQLYKPDLEIGLGVLGHMLRHFDRLVRFPINNRPNDSDRN